MLSIGFWAKANVPGDFPDQLKAYVQSTMKHFKDDKRILMWELYNEPGRGTGEEGDMASVKVKSGIGDNSKQLVYDSWVWAREIVPSQPITSCTAGSVGETNIKINRINSDIHSIHSYQTPDGLRMLVAEYRKYGRPLIMSEWLARDQGSTVQACLPVLKELNVGAVNWGFVAGKTETNWNWKSRKDSNGKTRSVKFEREQGNVVKPGETFPEPEVWFHDIFRPDGMPYDKSEIEVFKKLTSKK